MAPALAPLPPPISPNKLRLDLYSLDSSTDMDAASSSSSPPPLVTSVLASLLDRAIAKDRNVSDADDNNRDLDNSGSSCCRAFDGDRVVDLSLRSFLERISRYTRVGPPVYVVAYAYLDRLRVMNPGLRFHRGNAHRLVLVAVMVASKFVEDLNHRNSYFAKVGGLSTTLEMNRLEVEFLFRIRFKLHVNVSVFESYCSHLEREVSAGGGYHIERTLRSCAEAAAAFASTDNSIYRVLNQEGRRERQDETAAAAKELGSRDRRRRSEACDRPVVMAMNQQQRRPPLIGAAAASPY